MSVKNGVYHDITNADYHAGPGVSKSQLDDIALDPAIYLWRKHAPVDTEKTAALDMGSALHCMLLEPDEFDKRFIVAPAFNRRTTQGKTEEQTFIDEARHQGLTVLDAEQGRKLLLMRESALAHHAVRFLLETDGHCESSIFWTDDETRELCRIRPDKYITARPVIVDVKKVADMSRFRAMSKNSVITSRRQCIAKGLTHASKNGLNSSSWLSVKPLTADVIPFVYWNLNKRTWMWATPSSVRTSRPSMNVVPVITGAASKKSVVLPGRGNRINNMQTQLMAPSADSASTAAAIFSADGLEKLVRFAEIMASSRVTVPTHLSGNAADCLAVALQAVQWRMNPFAVAQKTFMVNGVLGYEAQLVNAVITTMSPTQDRLHYEWFGPWEKVIGKFVEKTSLKGNKYAAPGWSLADEAGCGVRVWATMKDEDEPRLLELLLSQAQVRNSTLWASDPKQQLAYLAVKRWARLHCPDVILGVYTPDEIEPTQPAERDITPLPQSDLNDFINQSASREPVTRLPDEPVPNSQEEDEMKADAPAPALPPASPVRPPRPPTPKPRPIPTPAAGGTAEGANADGRARTPDELLADFCEAAMNSKTVSGLAKCYAYASKVLAPTPPLLEKATDAFLVRKAELEEAAVQSKKS